MASLLKCARNVREEAADGIAWIAVWKVGRSWNAEPVWPDEFWYDGNIMTLSPEDMELLREAMKADPDAILVNGYYSNIGVDEDGKLPDVRVLADALRWQYEDCHLLISDWTLKEVS